MKACVRCHLPFEGHRKKCDTCARAASVYTQRWKVKLRGALRLHVCTACGQPRDNARGYLCVACRALRTPKPIEKRKERSGPVNIPTIKACPCGAEFPVEFGASGIKTRRVYCDDCRRARGIRRQILHRVLGDALHCRECTALVGPEYVTRTLNDAGLCESCARAVRRSA